MEMFKAYCNKTPPNAEQTAWYRAEIEDLRESIGLWDKDIFQGLAYCMGLEEALGESFERAHITSNKTRRLFSDDF